MSPPREWQAVFDQTEQNWFVDDIHASNQRNEWYQESILIPFYVVALSTISAFVHAIHVKYKRSRSADGKRPQAETNSGTIPSPTALQRIRLAQGGSTILAFKVLRIALLYALFALSLWQNIISRRVRSSEEHGQKPSLGFFGLGSGIAVTPAYWYSALLATIAILSPRWKNALIRHCNLVLFATWATLAYRDVWPLATFYLSPQDLLDSIFWVQFSLLSICAIAIPLLIPREYVPIDPKNPQKKIHPEQAASIASLLFYVFMDGVIFDARKVVHLSADQMPALPDYDDASYLRKRAFHAKKRHLFFDLMTVFRTEYSIMAIARAIYSCSVFVPPIAINRLLAYVETDGQDALFSPWLWIGIMFIGPVITSLSFQWYLHYCTTALFRAEAILVQLVFEHSLRIRSKTDVEGKNEKEEGQDEWDAEDATDLDTDTEVTTDGNSSLPGPKSKEQDVSATESKLKDNDDLLGRLNTFVTVDVGNITEAKDFLVIVLQLPLQAVIAIAFLYQILGWSALVAFGSIVSLTFVPGYLASFSQTIQRKKLDKTDARVQAIAEMLGSLRMIKLFGWEPKVIKALGEKRDQELAWMWKGQVVQMILDSVNFLIPEATMILTYATYVLAMKQPLNASKIFASISTFNIFRGLLHQSSWVLNTLIRGKVSLERIQEFIYETELLDHFDAEIKGKNRGPREINGVEAITSNALQAPDVIGFSDVVFSWAKVDGHQTDGRLTPSTVPAPKRKQRQFRLRIDGTVIFQRGGINLVIGPTGSGKTSILMALLGEMHRMEPDVPNSSTSWFNLPRIGGVAYAAQESWVQNETIRDNILFGTPYDEERYRKVIYQCALERDLELFDAGDATEVGEKGLTLSGGQKARVTLARALYSPAEILLLDDILAALDVHTSKWIVEKCLQGDLVKGRTIILVTHNVALTEPVADFIVAVGRDGHVNALGKDISALATEDKKFAKELKKEQEQVKQALELEAEGSSSATIEGTLDSNLADAGSRDATKNGVRGKLVVAEDMAMGRVSWKTLRLYIFNLSRFPLFFLFSWMALITLIQGMLVFSIYFLGKWGDEYDRNDPEDILVGWWLGRYVILIGLAIIAFVVAGCYYNAASIRASKQINNLLVTSILSSTLRWLDETPTGRIIARCTQDISSVDTGIPSTLHTVVRFFIASTIRLAGPAILNYIVLFPGCAILLLGILLANLYLKARMAVKREETAAKAPILSHFGAAMAGLVSVRAYGAQSPVASESLKRINHYSRMSKTSYALNRWVAIRIDLLGAMFTAGLASYLYLKGEKSVAVIGFSLTMSLDFCNMILILVTWWNELEVQANSLERIQAYLDIEHEPKGTTEGLPPAAWPTSGDLVVEKLTARYSPNGPAVLHNLSFTVKAGERIGIVGRTGSGKSSLTLALLRCIITEGTVRFDGIDTSKINLDVLRSSVTIIPQMPELLSGTLRRNLDPFEQNDDAALNSALRAAGLFDLQDASDKARLTLDSTIANGGGNLSVGQRQIIALARAIVRRSKLLILDEATSAIDHKTDTTIQTTLRQELALDATVLTVAHRLQTIVDADKVMVLDAGHIIEFDTPSVLLKKGGAFKAMVDGSGDKDALYAMAMPQRR